jgi:hypothetical protein
MQVIAGKIARATRQRASSRLTLTEQMFEKLSEFHTEQAGGAGGRTTLQDLQNMDKAWESVRVASDSTQIPKVVSMNTTALGGKPEYDIVVSGGTLGVFLSAALQLRGMKTAVLERGKLQGRAQEWNISREEIKSILELGILSEDDLEKVIGVEFNPVRVGFKVRTILHSQI